MKYIDAEKLIAEIERLLKCTELHRGEAVVDGSRQTLYWIKNFITSLQQEQPQVADASKMEQTEGYLEYWLEQFGMPKENIVNCAHQIAQGYGAIRYLEGIQHGAEAVNELAHQEQPEVDLITEYDEQFDSDPVYWKLANRNAGIAIARHFYDMGRNLRKEE